MIERRDIARCLSSIIKNDGFNPYTQDSLCNKIHATRASLLSGSRREQFCEAGFVGQVSMILGQLKNK